jgi:glycerol-3-phosphate cytidylyltransferase
MFTVYSYYVLDIIHRGHILMLKNSKAIAGESGKLVVGIVSDEAVAKKKGRPPIFNLTERMEIAQSIKYVDLVVIQKDYSPYQNIQIIKPNILMESDSHDEDQIEGGRKIMQELGGQVVVMPYLINQSSTNIKNKIREN